MKIKTPRDISSMRKVRPTWSMSKSTHPYVSNKTNNQTTINTNCDTGIENISERRKNWLKSIEQK